MIFDETTVFTATVPTVGLPLSLSNSQQLTAGSDGKPTLLGDGESICAEFEVTTAFATATDAILQMGLVVSDNATLDLNTVNLAFVGGTITATGTGRFVAGLTVLDLSLGARFHLIAPPHSRDITIAGTPSIPFNKAYIGFVLFISNYNDGGSVGFTAGAMKMRLALGRGIQPEQWQDRAAPSRMIVK